ncbi:hypothetical protein [Hymenobacter gummosus]|uniref:hypothetical protein n=1 Tax=Hymenobacter gummosus TaxID=1776032 RepID=UPI0014049AE5|nr:hypothetical protein [Hymenobacter gummosus]
MKQPNLDQWTTGFALVAFLGFFVAPLLYSQAGQRKDQIRAVSQSVYMVLLFFFVA